MKISVALEADRPIQSVELLAGQRLKPHHRMPDIFLIGAAKSATTSLANLLNQHPEIGLGSIKEPNFFSHQQRFARGLDWYSSLYDDVRADQLALDASTGYTRWPQNPGTAARIHACAPDAKLVYLMRHPVERAYSHFVHRWTKELYPDSPFRLSFEEHVKNDPICIDSSNYRAQIEEYLKYFPRESLLCVFTHDFEVDAIGVAQEICRFVGVSDSADCFDRAPSRDNQSQEYLKGRVRVRVTNKIKSIPILKSSIALIPKPVRSGLYGLTRRTQLGNWAERDFTPPKLTAEVRQRTLQLFADSNAWVAQFTGRDLSHWDR